MDKLNKTNERRKVRNALNDIEISLLRHKGSEVVKDAFAFETLVDAIQALEKQISKPVKITQPTPTMIYITCLNCGTFLDDRAKDNYCFGCGQKLDWS